MKKGYLQTLEAVIVIVLLVTTLVSFKFVGGQAKEEVPKDVRTSQDFILNSILTNNEIRAQVIAMKDGVEGIVIKDSNTPLSQFIYTNLPNLYDFKLQKCTSCAIPSDLPSTSVYTASIYLIEGTTPRTVYLYMYEK